jgi:hypothetical protein
MPGGVFCNSLVTLVLKGKFPSHPASCEGKDATLIEHSFIKLKANLGTKGN